VGPCSRRAFRTGRLRIQRRQRQANGRDAILRNHETHTCVTRIEVLQTGLSIAEAHARSTRRLAAHAIAHLDFEDAIFLRRRYCDPSPLRVWGNRRIESHSPPTAEVSSVALAFHRLPEGFAIRS
jgi:hypothetical protein